MVTVWVRCRSHGRAKGPDLPAITTRLARSESASGRIEDLLRLMSKVATLEVGGRDRTRMRPRHGQPVRMGVEQLDDGLTQGTRSPGTSSDIFL